MSFELAKRSLLRVGAILPDRAHYHLAASVDYLYLGHWMRRNQHDPPRYRSRSDLFTHLAARCRDERVAYLEFGVASGSATREWAQLLHNPSSELHGFDSFEGLPTDWIAGRPAGHFDQGGKVPSIADPRVHFHVGWFSDSLQLFEWPDGYERLIVNLDADLYSSTAEALTFIEPHIRPGTLLYFDELNHRQHELRALQEFLARGFSVRALGATPDLAHVGFEVSATNGTRG